MMKRKLPLFLSICLVMSLWMSNFINQGYLAEAATTSNANVTSATYSSVNSFESNDALVDWQPLHGGKISISSPGDNHAKDGSHSMKWRYTGSRSVLRLNNYTTVDQRGGGGLKVWIYNEVPIDDDLTFRIGTSSTISTNPRFTFTFHLNFKGWRALWIEKFNLYASNPNFIEDGLHPDTLEIQAPATARPGTLFFDAFDSNPSKFTYTSDYQVPYLTPANVELKFASQQPTLPPETTVTDDQKAAFDAIARKLDEYVLPSNINYSSLSATDPLKMRYNALESFQTDSENTVVYGIPYYLQKFNSYGISEDGSGKINGPGLFSSADTMSPKFTDFEKIWTSLLLDYKLNHNAASKGKLIALFDLFHDQGFAEGSFGGANTTIDDIRMSGYAYALYMMRNDLSPDRLQREMANLRWRTVLGMMFNYDPASTAYTFTVDKMRSVLLYQLMYILMMNDNDPEKVRYMKSYVHFVEQVIRPTVGFTDGIKPDYTMDHHDGVYMGAYGSEAIMALSEIAYLLSGTPFALDNTSTDTIKQVLLTYRESSNTYSLPNGLLGRQQENNAPMANIIGAYAFMGLAGDSEMARIFLDLWKPDNADVGAMILQPLNSINYFTTLGQMVLFQQAVNQFTKTDGYTAAAPPVGNWVKPYGGYALDRRDNWLVATKGFSFFNWDFEKGIDGYDENMYGRYINYGTTLILNRDGNVASGIDTANGWDWDRWPGATTKHLPFDTLKSLSQTYYHWFSDQTFLGGVSSQGMNGIFGMQLHDRAVDTSFRANKSWFYFGNEIIALGSDIKNTDATNRTETTLFQSHMTSSSMPYYYNSLQPVTTPEIRQVTTQQKIWMVDPYGNGYIIPNAKGLNVSRGSQSSIRYINNTATSGDYTTAWIDHGTQPTGGSYEYVIMPQSSPASVAAAAASAPDYTVLKKNYTAHIVKSNVDNTIGYVLFSSASNLAYGLLKAVSAPALVMEKPQSSNEFTLSVSDPNLRLAKAQTVEQIQNDLYAVKKASTVNQLTVTVNGIWGFKDNVVPTGASLSVDTVSNTTILTFDCVDGKEFEVNLTK